MFTEIVFVFLTVGLEPPPLSVSEERHLAILTELPFVVPFEERVKVREPSMVWCGVFCAQHFKNSKFSHL